MLSDIEPRFRLLSCSSHEITGHQRRNFFFHCEMLLSETRVDQCEKGVPDPFGQISCEMIFCQKDASIRNTSAHTSPRVTARVERTFSSFNVSESRNEEKIQGCQSSWRIFPFLWLECNQRMSQDKFFRWKCFLCFLKATFVCIFLAVQVAKFHFLEFFVPLHPNIGS